MQQRTEAWRQSLLVYGERFESMAEDVSLPELRSVLWLFPRKDYTARFLQMKLNEILPNVTARWSHQCVCYHSGIGTGLSGMFTYTVDRAPEISLGTSPIRGIDQSVLEGFKRISMGVKDCLASAGIATRLRIGPFTDWAGWVLLVYELASTNQHPALTLDPIEFYVSYGETAEDERRQRFECFSLAPDLLTASSSAIEWILSSDMPNGRLASEGEELGRTRRSPQETGGRTHSPVPKREPIEATRPVPLKTAAGWFKMDPRTLGWAVDDGTLAARQLSKRKWVFDLDELNNVNPTAVADAKPEGA